MKVLSTYKVRPGCLKEVARRMLSGVGMTPEGAKLIGRWSHSDASGGFSIHEVDDLARFARSAVEWSDVLEVNHTPVIDDAEAATALTILFPK